jgi:hypothetical protein
MPTDIGSLKTIELDYAGKGPNLHLGYARAVAALHENRTGFLRLHTKFSEATVSVIMRSEDLYLLGFRSADGWWRLSDADWPLTPTASSGQDVRGEGYVCPSQSSPADGIPGPHHRTALRVGLALAPTQSVAAP